LHLHLSHTIRAWERVYPELDDQVWAKLQKEGKPAVGAGAGTAKSLDSMMSSANIDQGLIDRLGKGFSNLSDSVSKMSDISGASVATKEYADKVKSASAALTEMNKSYSQTVQAMSEMSSAAGDAKQFHAQVQLITKNLGALNAVYEMELQDANNHLKAMNKFYNNLTSAMQNMADAGKDTEALKGEIGKLTANLGSLNKVYGNMLTAMKS
jgi:gliding motility-associated protein GldL